MKALEMNGKKKNYVIASATWYETADGKYVSYYEKQTLNGEYWFTHDIRKAMRFTFDEMMDYLKQHHNLSFLGFCVLRIEDVTFELFETNEELRTKYNDIQYALR